MECIFITNVGNNRINVLNEDGNSLGSFTLKGTCSFGAVAIRGPSGFQEVLIFDYCDSLMFVINPLNFSIVHEYECAGCMFGVYDPSNKMIYITQFGYGTVVPFNPIAGLFGHRINVCYSYPEFIALNGEDGKLYVPARASCYSVIDPNNNTSKSVRLGISPNGVACDTREKSLGGSGDCWISDTTRNKVYVVSGSKLLATLSGSKYPWGAVFDPVSQNGKGAVFVTSYNTSSVSVYSTDRLVKSVKTAYGADSLCLGPRGTVVAPLYGSFESGTVSGISETYKLIWTTSLGDSSISPESCVSFPP
jgi:hypothetical protein